MSYDNMVVGIESSKYQSIVNNIPKILKNVEDSYKELGRNFNKVSNLSCVVSYCGTKKTVYFTLTKNGKKKNKNNTKRGKLDTHEKTFLRFFVEAANKYV